MGPPLDQDFVGRLMARQFPQWVQLPLIHVLSAGTDNDIFRLGKDMAVRLPKVDWAAHQPEREHRWLPMLAGRLPLAIPRPIALGTPDLGYAWPWSICDWLEGEPATTERLVGQTEAAKSLAGFIVALRGIDATEAPPGGPGNHYRGVPLAVLHRRVRGVLAELEGRVDVEAATRVWNAALATPPWTEDPVWLHGDLHAQNLLAKNGRLSGVIDFGLMGAGDPATDLTAAWTMFRGEARAVFREASGVDDHTWSRGRGWALFASLIVLPFYWETNPTIVAHALQTLAEVLAE